MPRVALACFALASLLLAEAPAHAYLDPGAGSMLLQVLLGGTAAALVIGKMWWRQILGIFRSAPVNKPASAASVEPPRSKAA